MILDMSAVCSTAIWSQMYLFLSLLPVRFFSPGRKQKGAQKRSPKSGETCKKKWRNMQKKDGSFFCLSSAPTTNMPHAEHCGPSLVWRMYCTCTKRSSKKGTPFFCHLAAREFLFLFFACSASLVTTPSFKLSIFLRTSIHSKRDSVILGLFSGFRLFLGRSRTKARFAF